MRRLLNPLVLLFLCISLLVNVFFLYKDAKNSIVTRVPDGDSLDLSDGRRIRLLSLDAPEKGRCASEEARSFLTERVLGKRVRLAESITDDYGRQLANVYVGSLLVNEQVAKAGLAKFVYTKSTEYERVKGAALVAREQQLGIYSPLCRAKDPTTDCLIKGNLRHGTKLYQVPGCKQYDQIIIDQSFGDRWFCSEEEAVAAGFIRATGC